MNTSTTHRTEFPLAAPKMDFFRMVLGFLDASIRDLNRYLDAATLVHPNGRQEPETIREQFWEWPT